MGGNILVAILILGLLIFVHELGHFAVAKWSGVTVLRFSLGFGPRLFAWRRDLTEYAVSAVPLGGYVKMLGDDPEEEVPAADAARAFSQQSLVKRAGIVIAGPAMNLVTAAVAFSLVFAVYGAGTPSEAAKIGGVMEGMAAQKAGLRRGDVVTSVDGQPIASWDALSQVVRASGGKALVLEVARDDGSTATLTAVPEERPEKTVFGEEAGKAYLIGIERFVEIAPVSPVSAVGLGVYETYFWVKMTLLSVVKIFQGSVSARDLGGPILIVQAAGQQAERGMDYLIRFLGLISVNLGVLNLLPVPVLDGGHLVFFAFEAIRGRPLALRQREVAQQVGLFLLLALMVFVFYNDISRLIAG
ncbi:MAG: RIP metalloprotease RseP [Polyangiaceae bacterium UTPRO1]|jgi:regulator of sigma E protease|nr:RIP metalloprotease RseP [Myxococcales bacterium]OQY68691.1 MAG: RIP metalloprotease RseP [Polyangiaceae bacterium UTPRO1]